MRFPATVVVVVDSHDIKSLSPTRNWHCHRTTAEVAQAILSDPLLSEPLINAGTMAPATAVIAGVTGMLSMPAALVLALSWRRLPQRGLRSNYRQLTGSLLHDTPIES